MMVVLLSTFISVVLKWVMCLEEVPLVKGMCTLLCVCTILRLSRRSSGSSATSNSKMDGKSESRPGGTSCAETSPSPSKDGSTITPNSVPKLTRQKASCCNLVSCRNARPRRKPVLKTRVILRRKNGQEEDN